MSKERKMAILEIVEPICTYLDDGLSDDESRVDPSLLLAMVKRGVERGFESEITTLTIATFKEFLFRQKEPLLQLAFSDPVLFDVMIGRFKYNYGKVAHKLLTACNNGKRILSEANGRFPLWKIQGALFEPAWTEFYRELQVPILFGVKSIAREWSLIVILMRERELVDETMCMPFWKKQCPFSTSFTEAFESASLAFAKAVLDRHF